MKGVVVGDGCISQVGLGVLFDRGHYRAVPLAPQLGLEVRMVALGNLH